MTSVDVTRWCARTGHEGRLVLRARSRLCPQCCELLPYLAREVAEVYEALVEPRTGAGGDYVTGSTELRIPYADAAGDARERIRRTLASWCKLVVDERSVQAPRYDVGAMADFLALHAEWLAEHELAGYLVDELDELAWGKARGAAFGRSARAVERVTACPVCGAEATAVLRRAESLRPSSIECSAFPVEHRWESGAWLDLAPDEAVRLDTESTALVLRVGVETVYYYASARSRKRLERGDDGLFALADVRRLYQELWPVEEPCRS